MSPVKIRQANEWLVRLRDEAATDADRATFETWLDAEPENRDAYNHITATLSRAQRFRSHFQDFAEAPQPPERRRPAFAAITLAAAALLALGLFAGRNAIFPPTYVTAIGEQRVIELADGSRIELNTNSRLVVRYSDAARRVDLDRGEALFDVAHDAARPFIVEADDQTVRAIGTQFTVRVDSGEVSVLVIEGVVAVAARDVGAPQQAVPPPRLTAGQRLDVSGERPALATITSAEIERNLAWRTGWLQFNGQPLSYAASELARYSKTRFIIDDPALQDVPVMAYFRATDIEGFLANLEQNSPALAIVRTEDAVHFVRRPAPAPE